MGLDLRLHTLADRLESDSTVYVVEDRGEYQDDYQGGEQPADHEAHERQAEDVEAQVPAELCIGDAEVHGVGEQQPLLPATRHSQPGNEREQAGEHQADQAPAMAHQQVVAAQEVLFRAGRTDGGRQSIGDREVSVQEPEEQQGEQHHQDQLGTEHRHEDVLVAEGVEPQVVGPEPGNATQ